MYANIELQSPNGGVVTFTNMQMVVMDTDEILISNYVKKRTYTYWSEND